MNGTTDKVTSNWLIGIMVTILLLVSSYAWSSTIFPMVNRIIVLEQWKYEHEKEFRDRISRLEKDVERLKDERR